MITTRLHNGYYQTQAGPGVREVDLPGAGQEGGGVRPSLPCVCII